MTPFRGSASRFANAVARGRQQRQIAVTAARAAMAVARPLPPVDQSMFPRTYSARPAPYGEIKSWDVSPNPANIIRIQDTPHGNGSNDLSTGLICLNCGIQPGSAFYQRIGTKINMKSVHIRWAMGWTYAALTSAAGAAYNEIRVMLVYDRQPNGAYPGIADILGVNDTGSVTMNAGINMANRSRFTMLRDQMFDFDAASQIGKTCNWYVKLKGLETEYKAGTADIAAISTGSLLFLFWYDGEGAVVQPDIVDFESRVRYYD